MVREREVLNRIEQTIADFEEKKAAICVWLENGAIDELRARGQVVQARQVEMPSGVYVNTILPKTAQFGGSSVSLEIEEFRRVFDENRDVVSGEVEWE